MNVYASVSNPGPLICMDFGRLDPDPEGQKDPQNYKKVKALLVLRCWMFSFES